MATNPTGLSPSTITSNLLVWYNGTDSSSIVLSGSNVTQWQDRSGNGFNLAPKSSSFPTLSNLNGFQALYFPANGGLINSNIGISSSYSVFAVANRSASATQYQYISKFNSSADGFLFFGVNSGNFATFAGNGSTTWWDLNANSPTTPVATTPLLLEATNSSTVLTPYASGIALNTKNGTTVQTTGLILGMQVDNSQPWLGNIGEYIVYNKVLSTSERQQVEGYLAWKWGTTSALPSTHPYKNFPFLPTVETIPRSIPDSTCIIPINTYSTVKTFTLPVVSTNAGRILIFKDYLGYSAINTIQLSTIGLDRIERSSVSSMTLSNTYGAWTFMNDGLTNWFLTNAYLNSLGIVQPTPPFLPGLWVKSYANTGQQPDSNGPATFTGSSGNWGALLTTTFNGNIFANSNTPGPSSYVYYGNNYGIAPSGNNNYSLIMAGAMFSAAGGTIQFQVVTDDGFRLDYNGANAILSWRGQGATTYTSAVLTMPAGYTPIVMRWFDTGGGGASIMSYNMNGTGYTSNGTNVYFYATSNITQT
jgi:hypothetical protein